MAQFWPELPIAFGLFAGAIVSSFSGFAFSAIAGAVLLHFLPATNAIPLMMLCSIAIQAVSLLVLRSTMNWKGSLIFIAGGIIGVPAALYGLYNTDTLILRMIFGMFLVAYSLYTLIRPAPGSLHHVKSRFIDGVIGVLGGVIGGFTAMPGALVSIWCDLRGLGNMRKEELCSLSSCLCRCTLSHCYSGAICFQNQCWFNS